MHPAESHIQKSRQVVPLRYFRYLCVLYTGNPNRRPALTAIINTLNKFFQDPSLIHTIRVDDSEDVYECAVDVEEEQLYITAMSGQFKLPLSFNEIKGIHSHGDYDISIHTEGFVVYFEH